MARCLCIYHEILNVVDLAVELVKINSVPTADHGETGMGEAFLAQWLKQYFENFDFQVNLFPVDGNRSNMMARHQTFVPGLPTLAFEAHLDTVSTEGMTISPFGAEIRDGRLYGRGATDVKGTMAVMITAMLNWFKKHQYEDLPFNLIFLATMGEEGGTFGAKDLVRRPIPLDMVLSGEPTNMDIVTGHNGTWRFQIQTTGKSCHSSTPHLGINAIDIMADVMHFLKSDLKPVIESTDGNALSMTLVKGGDAINIIPNSCEVTVDCRYGPGSDIEGYKSSLLNFINTVKGAQYKELLIYPPFALKEDSRLLPLMQETLNAMDIEHVLRTAPWYSDAGQFSGAGYDTLLWGVGDMQQAHTEDEFIETAQLEQGILVLNKLLENFKSHFE